MRQNIFRLYFVDAPEIETVNPQRLIEQAKYFGMSVPQAIELGRAADSFVRDRLSKPFTVITRFAHSMSRGKAERFYAFVQNEDGDLGEQLVANVLRASMAHLRRPRGSSARLRKEPNSSDLKMKRGRNKPAAGVQRESVWLFGTRSRKTILPNQFHLIRRKKPSQQQR